MQAILKITSKKSIRAGLLLLTLACSSIAFSQSGCSNFKLVTDYNDYSVNPATHDSSFVKYIQFDINDTSNIHKISYSFTDLGTSTVLQAQDYVFGGPFSANLAHVNKYIRNKRTVRISLGKFPYQAKDFRVQIDLKNARGNIVGSSDFDFSH